MEFLRTTAFRGPNPYHARPVVELLIDCRGWRDEKLSRVRQRLVKCLPFFSGEQSRPSKLAAGARETRSLDLKLSELLRGHPHHAHVAELLERFARAMQWMAGVVATYGSVKETDDPDVRIIAIEYEEESLVRACLETARELIVTSAERDDFPLVERVRQLVDLADDVRLGPSSRAIVDAAIARGIPYRRLNRSSLVQLGEGCQQRRIWTAETDATSAIAESIASDKDLTKQLLSAVGVPVPRGRVVRDAEDAWQAAQEIGVPVVVKPQNANHARGVSLDLTRHEQVLAAYDFAVKLGEGSPVMVEQYARGQHHRLLVVGGRLVAAACGESEYVDGDGVRSVNELVDEVNRDPRRGINYTDPLDLLMIDEAAIQTLAKQGLNPDSIPEAGRRVLIQHVGDLTTDCTHGVHPDVAARAVLAAQTIGLDIAGLDVIAQDISRPLEAQRGMILEVNAGPSLSMHVAPLQGEPQPVGAAIIDLIFPPGRTGRIPVVAVTGGERRRGIAEQLAAWLESNGRMVGLATSAMRRFGQHEAESNPKSDRSNVESLLVHRSVEVAIFESRPWQAAREGLSCSRCDVVVVAQDEVGSSNRNESAVAERSRAEMHREGILAAIHALSPAGTLVLATEDPDAEIWSDAYHGRIIWCSSIEDFDRPVRTSDTVITVVEGQVRGRSGGNTWSWQQDELVRLNSPSLATIAAAFALGVAPHHQ